jgi:PAS domain S-box-containing protein
MHAHKMILLVENNVTTASDIKLLLEKSGFHVTNVLNGTAAIAAISILADPPDLILLDLNLRQEMDGVETARQILRMQAIPILFLYAPADACLIEKSAALAGYGYVDKNSGPAVLLAAVQAALRLHKTQLLAQTSPSAGPGVICEGIFADTFGQNQVEAALRESEATLRTWLNAIQESAFMVDQQGILLMTNAIMAERLHHSVEEMIGANIFDYIPIETANHRRIFFNQVFATGQPVRFEDERFGRIIDNLIYPVFDPDGKIRKLAILGTDITEQKHAEERINSLLAEKEVLLREVHHRIKNNMSTITSLLELQANSTTDEAVQMALQDASGRVRSMMVLYDKLYRSENYSSVSLREYIPSLLAEILNLFPNHAAVQIQTTIDEIFLVPRNLSALGIILTELTTNAMKYAFPGGKGTLTISARQEAGRLAVSFADDGIGLPAGFTPENSPGFGMQLVAILAHQLHADYHFENENGTRFRMTFRNISAGGADS